MENNVIQRIRRFSESQKLSIRKFEKKCGLSNGYLASIKNSPTLSKIDKILEAFPELNKDWLLTGEGAMLNASDDGNLPVISYSDGVPYYDEDFCAGFDAVGFAASEFPKYLIKMPGYERADLWCNVSGRSMEPEISNGDLIALKLVNDPTELLYGDIYGFITTNDLRTVKRLGRSDKAGYYRLIPTNKDYDEQDIPISSIVRVFRVLGAMKSF